MHKIAIFSDELENIKQLNFSLHNFENDNIEFEKKCSDLHNSLQDEICLKEGLLAKNQKEFKSKAETALWFVESNGLVPQYLKLESTDGPTAKVDFNPLSSKSSYKDLPEEERQRIKDLLFILEKFNFSESAYRELPLFCDGLPRTYLVSSMPGRY